MNGDITFRSSGEGRRRAVEIHIRGIVQGVGFRPTVWRWARAERLTGEVFNVPSGVVIRLCGPDAAIKRFSARLRDEPPPLARIESIEIGTLDECDYSDFRIAASGFDGDRARIAPDAATCAECLREVFDLHGRRHGYAFTNCTHCGPRFSIVTSVPYDRRRTTMGRFPLCEECRREYEDPADRRFHAQPIACPACGPDVWLELRQGPSRSLRGNAAVGETVRRLLAGAVIAIRGLGGFHIACLATNTRAVQRLRDGKLRFGKPFALMARDLAAIRRYCILSPTERELLESPSAPIVLLEADGPERLPEAVASGLGELGFMLPYTPLHALLLDPLDEPLVMTSGNLSDEPQIVENKAARHRLSKIVDGWLMHNRPIANRVDDSVAHVVGGKPRLLRRARGYAPGAVPLPPGFEGAPELLAFGGELKAAFCLLKDGGAILSQHQGDLEEAETYDDYCRNLELYRDLYDHRPQLLAADAHPDYLSSKLAREKAAQNGSPLYDVLHHHAHIASCMAENAVPRDAPPVLGIVLDGLGFGPGGEWWGGEFLLADYRQFQRVAALKPVAMPGGAAAVRQPWRNTYAHLASSLGWEAVVSQFPDVTVRGRLEAKPLAVLDQMLNRGLNAPPASSCGRLFDAVAAALGFCFDRTSFEGQGAMLLESAARPVLHPAAGGTDAGAEIEREGCVERPGPYPFTIAPQGSSALLQIDAAPMWRALLQDLADKRPVSWISARFHLGLVAAIGSTVDIVRRRWGTRPAPIDVVALSGGCFQNRILLDGVTKCLERKGICCLSHAQVPANDGGLALGQTVVAAARWSA